MVPFLLWTINAISLPSQVSRSRQRRTYPGHPGTLSLAKCNLPCGFQRLKEFIGLEEGADDERIDKSECDQAEEDVGGRGGGRLRRDTTRGSGHGGRHGEGWSTGRGE